MLTTNQEAAMVTRPSIHPSTCSAHSKVVVVDDMQARTSSGKISPGSQHRHACQQHVRTYRSAAATPAGPFSFVCHHVSNNPIFLSRVHPRRTSHKRRERKDEIARALLSLLAQRQASARSVPETKTKTKPSGVGPLRKLGRAVGASRKIHQDPLTPPPRVAYCCDAVLPLRSRYATPPARPFLRSVPFRSVWFFSLQQ